MDFKMDKDFKINNHTDMDVNGLSGEITRFYPYAKEKLGFDKPVIVNLLSDPENSKNIFGKTAQYNPSNMTIDIFIDGRHPKDILRSLSHELVHHTQNCRGDFDNLGPTEKGYAQKDPFLRKLEAEAYLLGNGLLFRDFEDMRKSKMKVNENKFNLKNMVRRILNETINEYGDTMETMYEDGYEEYDEAYDELDEKDDPRLRHREKGPSKAKPKVDFSTFRGRMAAKKVLSKKDWKKGMNKWWAGRKARKAAKRKSDGPKVTRTMNFSDKEGSVIKTPVKRRKRSSDKQNALLQKLLRLTDPAAKPKEVAKKADKPKAPKKTAAKRKSTGAGAKPGEDAFDAATREAGIKKSDLKPGKFKGIPGLTKKIASKNPKLKSRDIKIASPEQMAAWAGKSKKSGEPKKMVAKPGTKGKGPAATKVPDPPKKKAAKPAGDAKPDLKENVDLRNDKEWYNDTLFENLVKKWTK